MTSDITDVELHASNQYKVIYHGLKRFKPSVNVKNVKFHSDDGDVNFDDLRISSGKITSGDGDISVSNLLTRKGATVESDDGDIRIRKSNASGYRLTSDDGDVTFKGDTSDNDDGGSYYKNTKSSNLLSAHSDDGDVNVN